MARTSSTEKERNCFEAPISERGGEIEVGASRSYLKTSPVSNYRLPRLGKLTRTRGNAMIHKHASGLFIFSLTLALFWGHNPPGSLGNHKGQWPSARTE